MDACDLFTIGHSNVPLERFLTLLRHAGVGLIADVRTVPYSRFCPWFSQKQLAAALSAAGVEYVAMGETLGGRPRDDRLYRNGVASYEAMAMHPEYHAGIERVLDITARRLVCILCAEREPLDCHRCLLVARTLAERGVRVGHILHNGAIEPHAATERRLLALAGQGDDGEQGRDLFASGQHERLAAAYRRRAHAVAFRQTTSTPRAAPERR
jgi:uncharacterized protein (DUF488 family)